jgi:hypothetical protein
MSVTVDGVEDVLMKLLKKTVTMARRKFISRSLVGAIGTVVGIVLPKVAFANCAPCSNFTNECEGGEPDPFDYFCCGGSISYKIRLAGVYPDLCKVSDPVPGGSCCSSF